MFRDSCLWSVALSLFLPLSLSLSLSPLSLSPSLWLSCYPPMLFPSCLWIAIMMGGIKLGSKVWFTRATTSSVSACLCVCVRVCVCVCVCVCLSLSRYRQHWPSHAPPELAKVISSFRSAAPTSLWCAHESPAKVFRHQKALNHCQHSLCDVHNSQASPCNLTSLSLSLSLSFKGDLLCFLFF